MATIKHTVNNLEFTFSDTDMVNPDAFIPAGEYNPHNVRPFLFHDHGFPLAVVFADCLQDALDEAADADKLDGFLVEAADLAACEEDPFDIYSPLGNASELFDIEGVDFLELPAAVVSALLAAAA